MLLHDYRELKSPRDDSVGHTIEYVKLVTKRTQHLCRLNGKLNLHAVIWTYQDNSSLTLSIRAETQLSEWIDISYYSVDYDTLTPAKLAVLEQNLLNAWSELNYRGVTNEHR